MPTLHWLTRDEDIKAAGAAPYRLLEEDSKLGCGDKDAENMLIQGDNLEALKALLPFYAGRVKCVFIDPPYNTRSAFEQYDDNLEHTQWLEMIWPRLELLRSLLSEDGSIWVTIDDNEAHYLKVAMDEIFGRKNFIANTVWQKIFSPKNTARHFSNDHDHILVFSKSANSWTPNPMPRSEQTNKNYKNPDSDQRGPWTSSDVSARNPYNAGLYAIKCPGGRLIAGPPNGRFWTISEERFWALDRDNRIWWGESGNNAPRVKRFLSEVKQGIVPQTLWMNKDVGNTQEAKKEIVSLFGTAVFMTPKPERLLQRILHIASNSGDLVLDSFLGSGTAAAVAHKMGRRYIGIEMGDHAERLCAARLEKVIGGEQGGISKAVNWRGGGGFRFYRLGPAVFDETGNIRANIGFPVLAAHIWFSETLAPLGGAPETPFLGVHKGRAYALLYNGVLGDKRVNGGNVLTRAVLKIIRDEIKKPAPDFHGPLIIYGERTALGRAALDRENIIFKQTPYDVKARG